MTTQLAVDLPQPPMPQADLTVEFDGTVAAISIDRADDGGPEVHIVIPRAMLMSKAEALESIAALRVLLAAAEGALRANDGAGEREGEVGER